MLKNLCVGAIAVCLAISCAYAQNTTSKYDGLYSGTARLTNSASPACAGSELYAAAVLIKNGNFRYMYSRVRNEFITGSISPEGTIDAAGNSFSGGNRLTGKIQNGKLQGTVGSGYCSYMLELNFMPDMAGLKDGLSCSRLRDICYQLSGPSPRKGCDDRFDECMRTGQWDAVVLNRVFSAVRN